MLWIKEIKDVDLSNLIKSSHDVSIFEEKYYNCQYSMHFTFNRCFDWC